MGDPGWKASGFSQAFFFPPFLDVLGKRNEDGAFLPPRLLCSGLYEENDEGGVCVLPFFSHAPAPRLWPRTFLLFSGASCEIDYVRTAMLDESCVETSPIFSFFFPSLCLLRQPVRGPNGFFLFFFFHSSATKKPARIPPIFFFFRLAEDKNARDFIFFFPFLSPGTANGDLSLWGIFMQADIVVPGSPFFPPRVVFLFFVVLEKWTNMEVLPLSLPFSLNGYGTGSPLLLFLPRGNQTPLFFSLARDG